MARHPGSMSFLHPQHRAIAKQHGTEIWGGALTKESGGSSFNHIRHRPQQPNTPITLVSADEAHTGARILRQGSTDDVSNETWATSGSRKPGVLNSSHCGYSTKTSTPSKPRITSLKSWSRVWDQTLLASDLRGACKRRTDGLRKDTQMSLRRWPPTTVERHRPAKT